MATHKSAKKRSRQTLKRNFINRSLLSKIKNNINNFNSFLSSKQNGDNGDLEKSFSLINSSLARALKRGVLKKEFVSRKLSSLSNKLKQK